MRTLLLDLPGLCGRLTDSLPAEQTPAWFTNLAKTGRTIIEPVLPAVTMTAQATYSTGVNAAGHGMIANGLPAYRLPEVREHLDLTNFEDYRCNVSFWEQSNKLLTAERVWKKSRRRTALMMVQSSMGGAADVVVTPKPTHSPDGKTVSMCWSDPATLHPKLREQLGEFPLMHYWGPLANLKSSQWIASAARLVWEIEPCDLHWVYIPQMDYDLQRFGPGDARCTASLVQTLALLTPLAEKALADGGRVLMVSEYGMTGVSRVASPNVALARAGLLVHDDDGEMDYASSRAFAMVDHQIAHVYCADEDAKTEAGALLGEMSEVAIVYCGRDRRQVGLDCKRAGDVVAFSREDAWFEYRWWEDWADAPAWAWTVDIHRKPGYDPTEMFADPATRKILANKPQLVRGSHGTKPAKTADWPVLLGHATAGERIAATAVAGLI